MAPSRLRATVVVWRIHPVSIGPEAEGGIEDGPREPHPADRGGQELGVLIARAGDDASVRQSQGQALHMVAEPAIPVVVLAMDIRGDHAADGDELGARHNRREEALWDHDVEQIGEQDAGFHLMRPVAGSKARMRSSPRAMRVTRSPMAASP